ncbi:hypothetical protein K8T06_06130, partial [bacterium]|nr:hypothetical protein [bacterium]
WRIPMETNPTTEQMRDDAQNYRSRSYGKNRQLYKSPLLAGLLSILPGLGQVYLGYYKHGFLFIFGFGSLTLLASSSNGGSLPIFVFACMFFYCFSIIDAVRRAKIYNQVIDGISQAELPDSMEVPSLKGSLGLGVTFVVGGFILFLHTMFGMSLAWIADWWPVAVIGFGAYLIYKDLKDRSKLEKAED